MALFRMKSMRNSFGYLNISHGIADCFVLIMFIVWFAPMLMLNSELGHTLVGIRLSQLTGLFMCGSVHSAIAIAFSRYVALIHPLRYSIFFTKQRTIKFAAFAWTIALIHHVPNIFPDCFYYFDFRRYAWMYNDTQCGQFLSWFTDLCYGLTMLMLVGGPNLATIFQLHQASKAKSALAIIEAQSIKRQRREWRFFLQAFMSSTIIMIIFMTFHLVKKTMTLRFIHFLTSCLCVILVHGTNRVDRSMSVTVFMIWFMLDEHFI
ncbi:unnamed protein product [Toxocara canis]|uniref:G_PROTEIN_RECEP_F1_2 domain-containing protein n=1 Tax=Toxocara canis TaxID=6265 RepID=A0A183VCX7_TOXCA|nr:unnamed protein product [Toxocara canis]